MCPSGFVLYVHRTVCPGSRGLSLLSGISDLSLLLCLESAGPPEWGLALPAAPWSGGEAEAHCCLFTSV